VEESVTSTSAGSGNAPCFVGINFAAGAAYFGAVRHPDVVLVNDPADRLETNAQLPIDGRSRTSTAPG